MLMAEKRKTVEVSKPRPVINPPLTPLTGRPGPAPLAPRKIKKRLTTEEEFEILKMVFDKILWLGFGIMALGLYEIYQTVDNPFALMFAGAVILIIFIIIIVREYEIVQR